MIADESGAGDNSRGKDSNEDNERDVGEERHDRHDATSFPPRFRVILDLGVVKQNTHLLVTLTHRPRPWNTRKTRDPPHRENQKPKKE